MGKYNCYRPQEEGVQFGAQSDQMFGASMSASLNKSKDGQNPPNVKQLCIPPLSLSLKKNIGNQQNWVNLTHFWSFVFWKTRKITRGSDVSFLNFQHLFGGCFVANPGEPPKRRHAENAAALLENVRGTQGSGWYGRAYCFTTMIRWWTTTWYSFSLLLFLAWLSLFWVIIVVVAAGVAAAVVVFCVRSFQS